MDDSKRFDGLEDTFVSYPLLRYSTRQFLCRDRVARVCWSHGSRVCAIFVFWTQVSLIYSTLSRSQADGYLARKYNMGSVLGSILDPAADKALMTTLVVTLTIRGLVPRMFAHASSYNLHLIPLDLQCRLVLSF